MSQVSPLQPVWDGLLDLLGVGFFEFPLYFLPVVVAVVLLTGIGFSIADVAIYRRISAKAATKLGIRIMSTYVGAAVLLFVLHATFHVWTAAVPGAAPTLPVFVAQLIGFMVVGEFLTYWWHRLEHESSRVSCALPFLGRMARCQASTTRTPRPRRSDWSVSMPTTTT
ncbi:hypothetical protein, partial [Mycobacterium innocens]|uniref:hypothetical protein n=1 Tax=Mycobacterium innocens TaxID=2341083 RepID=UPI00142D8C36